VGQVVTDFCLQATKRAVILATISAAASCSKRATGLLEAMCS